MMKAYRDKNVQFMRPYLVGEDLEHVSVPYDNYVAVEGDMIAFNENDPTDVWLISKEFFDNNYVEVSEPEWTEA